MERQYKKNSKGLVVLLSIIIVVLVGALGYFVYDSYFKDSKGTGNKGNVLSKTNYYSADYLLSNNFITEAYTYSLVKGEENVDYWLYKNDKGYYLQYFEDYYRNDDDFGTKDKYTKIFDSSIKDRVYYNVSFTDSAGAGAFYDIMRLDSSNNLYYSYYGLSYGLSDGGYGLSGDGYSTVKTFTDEKKYKDYKIENVKNVYRLTSDKSNRNLRTIAILEMTNGDMKVLMDKYKGTLGNDEVGIKLVDLKDVYPYFDYICAYNGPICNDTMFYITFDKKMVPNYNLNKPVVDESGEEIKVKDAFSTLKTSYSPHTEGYIWYPGKNGSTYKYTFTYVIYILSDDNNLYKLELNKDIIDNKKEVSAKIYKKDVSSIDAKYMSGAPNNADDFVIDYANNTREIVDVADIFDCTSTMYDRRVK